MIRNPNIRNIVKAGFLWLLILPVFQIAVGQESQSLSRDEFNSELRKALSGGDDQKAFTLILDHRQYVKPFVDGLIKESLIKEMTGKVQESDQAKMVATKAAAGFEKLFGENSLETGVNYLNNWSKYQKMIKLTADSLYSSGTAFRLGNDPERALDCFENALDMYRSIMDERGEAEVLGGLGALYFNNIQDYEKALIYYKEALLKREKVNDKALIGNTLNSLGTVYNRYLQDYLSSIHFYEKAEALRIEIGDSAGLLTTRLYKADALKAYGEQLGNKGRYNEAISLLEKAFNIATGIDAGFEAGETLSILGFVYSKLGDYSKAVDKLTEAAKIMKEVNDSLGLAGVYNHFGVALQRAGRAERALGFYNNALEIYREKGELSDQLPVISNLGTLFFDLKDYARALDYHTSGLKISREINDRVNEIDYRLNLANDQIFLGNLKEAMTNYKEGLLIARDFENPDLVWRITAGMAECYELLGDYEKAVELNDSALKIIDGIRNTIQDEELKTTFMARERFAYEDIIGLLEVLHEKDRTKGYDNVAFNYAERSKSRVLLDLLYESSPGIGIKRQNDSKRPDPDLITLEEAKALCPDKNSVILEYSLGDSISCLWVITPTDHHIFRIPGRKILREQIETLRFSLLDPQQDISGFLTHSGSFLYNELIKPAEPYLSKKSKLIIIPDGVLHYLPFEVLISENKPLGTNSSFKDLPFLVKKYPLSYVQSASVLKRLISKQSEKADQATIHRTLIAFGDPLYEDLSINPQAKYPRLEFTGKEIEKISSFFNGGSDIYLRYKATEERLKQNGDLDKYGYIHFATHGTINEEEPDLSSLVLTAGRDSGEDGFLLASEIFNLKLNAGLVVLSACQTGLGKLVRGEGMIGLTRAFMYAGAPSVVVSLWNVSDLSTAIFMGEFYKNLIKHKHSKTDALRKAQIALISDEKYSHPFYWAPFILVGDWR